MLSPTWFLSFHHAILVLCFYGDARLCRQAEDPCVIKVNRGAFYPPGFLLHPIQMEENVRAGIFLHSQSKQRKKVAKTKKHPYSRSHAQNIKQRKGKYVPLGHGAFHPRTYHTQEKTGEHDIGRAKWRVHACAALEKIIELHQTSSGGYCKPTNPTIDSFSQKRVGY